MSFEFIPKLCFFLLLLTNGGASVNFWIIAGVGCLRIYTVPSCQKICPSPSVPRLGRDAMDDLVDSEKPLFDVPKKVGTPTVDGSEIRRENQLRLVVYPIIYKVLAPSQVVNAGFQPSTVLVPLKGPCKPFPSSALQ